MTDKDHLFYTIALSMVKNIGPVNAKMLIEKFGSAAYIFNHLPLIKSKIKLSSKLTHELKNPQISELKNVAKIHGINLVPVPVGKLNRITTKEQR